MGFERGWGGSPPSPSIPGTYIHGYLERGPPSRWCSSADTQIGCRNGSFKQAHDGGPSHHLSSSSPNPVLLLHTTSSPLFQTYSKSFLTLSLHLIWAGLLSGTYLHPCRPTHSSFQWDQPNFNGAHYLSNPHEPHYPACACAARGKVISRGWWCPGGVHKKIYSFFGTNLLSLKILTFRALFQHR